MLVLEKGTIRSEKMKKICEKIKQTLNLTGEENVWSQEVPRFIIFRFTIDPSADVFYQMCF